MPRDWKREVSGEMVVGVWERRDRVSWRNMFEVWLVRESIILEGDECVGAGAASVVDRSVRPGLGFFHTDADRERSVSKWKLAVA